MHGQSAGAFPASRSPLTTLEKSPAEFLKFLLKYNPRRGVPITASGPQGEQPLFNMKNAGKGSRQIRPVTLGKGLALVLRGSGCRILGAPARHFSADSSIIVFFLYLYERNDGFFSVALSSAGVSGCDDAHSMQQTRTATGKGNPTV